MYAFIDRIEANVVISGLTTLFFNSLSIYLFKEINSYAVARCTNGFIIFTAIFQFPHILHICSVPFLICRMSEPPPLTRNHIVLCFCVCLNVVGFPFASTGLKNVKSCLY